MAIMGFAAIRFVRSVDGLQKAVVELRIVVSSTAIGQKAISDELKDVKTTVKELEVKSDEGHDAIVQNKEQIKTLFAQTGHHEAEINALRVRVGSAEITLNTVKNLHKLNHNQDIHE